MNALQSAASFLISTCVLFVGILLPLQSNAARPRTISLGRFLDNTTDPARLLHSTGRKDIRTLVLFLDCVNQRFATGSGDYRDTPWIYVGPGTVAEGWLRASCPEVLRRETLKAQMEAERRAQVEAARKQSETADVASGKYACAKALGEYGEQYDKVFMFSSMPVCLEAGRDNRFPFTPLACRIVQDCRGMSFPKYL